MHIMNYYIPEDLRDNPFLLCLYRQENDGGEFSYRQIEELQDIIGISLDYWHYDVYHVENSQDDFDALLKKLKSNKFKNVNGRGAGRNRCIRALNSLVENNPRRSLIYAVIALL